MSDDYRIVVEPCKKEGQKTIKVLAGNRQIYIHSKYDPVSEAAKQIEKLPIGPGANYIMFGLGMGHHLRALLKRLKREDENKIAVFEPNNEIYEMFMNDENNFDIFNDERIRIELFTTITKTNELLNILYKSTSSYLDNFLFILPIYKDIYTEKCRDFAANIKSQILICYLAINTNILFSKIWFNCYLKNPPLIMTDKGFSGKKLIDLYKGIPAVIVSAGPSLEKNIQLINEMKDKAVIISVDTAYKPLYTRGISPHFTVTIDAQPIVLGKFKDTDLLEADLITSFTSSTKVLTAHTGRKVVYSNKNIFIDDCFKDLGIELINLESGGSVACTALDIAYKMGADPIIFIGQDLAYTDKRTHIEGAAYSVTTDEILLDDVWAVGVNGEKIPSTYNLNQYREWIEMFIHLFKDRKYVDATEGGAKIEGTEIIALRETIDKYCNNAYNITEIKEQLFTQDNLVATKEQFKGFIGHMERSYKYLKKKLPEIKACKLACDKIIKEVNSNGFKRPARITSPYDRIRRLNKSLDENEHYVDIILPLMSLYREEATRTDHLRDKTLSEEKLLALNLEKYGKYFEALAEKIAYAVPLIEEAVANNTEVYKDE